jgi:CheY-like chemotaxis protein/HPt (histidine-containing phosphotransfer) domain-containing protein
VLVSREKIVGQEKSTFHFHIIDTGIGMDDVTSGRVFEPFTQADASTTRQYGGTGLGLSITKNYVELMGGAISVDSELNMGTSVHMEIPLLEIRKLGSKSKMRDMRSLSFAIISSHKSTRSMISEQLKRLGASKVEELDELAEQTNLQEEYFLFIDLQNLNREISSELWRNIKDRTAIITPLNSFDEYQKLGASTLISKPTTMESVTQAVANWADESRRPTPTYPIRSNRPTNEKLKILVAEDIQTNQRIASEVIKMCGYNADIAENGEQAVQMQCHNRYDLIFMDCQMPLMDGFEATRSIREDEASSSSAPCIIIALTAGTTSSDRKAFFEAGMDGFLGKPFRVEDIRKVLSTHFGEDELSGSQEVIDILEVAPHKDESSSDANHIDDSAIANILHIQNQTGKSILKEVYDGFCLQMDQKIFDLSEEENVSNPEHLKSLAHAVKSMSANLGAKEVKAIAGTIESDIKSGKEVDYVSARESIEAAYSEFKITFSERYHEHLQ